jgi:ribosomal protein S18 acetylase RimI-like enzyme
MIRQASFEDVDLIAGLEMLLFPENCINEHSVGIELEAGFGYVVGEGHGYALVRPDGNLWDIIRLGVHPNHQGMGHAQELLLRVVELADHKGKSLILTVRKSNAPAMHIYRKHGFEPIASMPQHEAIVLARPVPTSPLK